MAKYKLCRMPFHMLIWIFLTSLVRVLVRSFGDLFNGVVLFIVELRIICILNYKSFIQYSFY
jgi:hypothetical protein